MDAGANERGPAGPLLRDTLAACRGGFAAIVVFSLGINLLMLTAPLYMLQTFDRVLSSRSTDTLILLSLMAAVAILTLAALEVVRSQILLRVSAWLDRRLSGPVLAGSIDATLHRGEGPSVQGLRDVATFRTFLSGPAMFPILDAPWAPIFLAVIFIMHPVLGWIALAGALTLFAFAVTNELATRKLLMRSGGASIRALNRAEATVRNADAIEAMGMAPNLVARWHKDNAEMMASQSRASNRSAGITAASKFTRLGLQIGILGAGSWLVLGAEITPGTMIAASIIMARALAPVEQAIGSWRSMIAARGAYQRVKRQLGAMPARGAAMPLPVPTGKLTVTGVGFQYPGAADPILRGVSLKIEPGQSVGVIGPSAAGKTTLARLLVGNLTPAAGHVRLDGADVATWEREDLGRHIGYLPQDIELFAGTVRENIGRMGAADADAVIAAARVAEVHDMVLRLPQGYETEIGHGGVALSGGQRQRVALARAVFGEPKLVVLDEPNSNLDYAGEEALVRTLAALKGRGVTLIVIAHRPAILTHADDILVLGKGAVRMYGPSAEVIARLTHLGKPDEPPEESQPEPGVAVATVERPNGAVTDIRDGIARSRRS